MAEKKKEPEKTKTVKKKGKEVSEKAKTVKKEGREVSEKTETVKKKEPEKAKVAKKKAKEEPKKTKTTKKKGKPKAKKTDKVNIYSINGKTKGKVKLPKVFFEDVRVDLIRRAVNASQSHRRQPYGPNPMSGMRHASSTWGKGRGVARVQRMSQGRTAVESPPNVGGRRAHPPKPEKDWSKRINRKERRAARNSALSGFRPSRTWLTKHRATTAIESVVPCIRNSSVGRS